MLLEETVSPKALRQAVKEGRHTWPSKEALDQGCQL